MTSQDDTVVGFVGLGAIGAPMARRVVDAGYRTIVHDVDPNATAELVHHGGEPAESLSKLIVGVDVLLLCVAFEHQLRDIMFGELGVMRYGRPGLVVVVHSTASPRFVEELAEQAAAKEIAVIDAPVSGGVLGAEEGTLTVMIGGDEEALAGITGILESFAANIFHLGSAGSGQVAKLVNNLLLASNRLAVIESLRLARAYDVSIGQLMEAVSVSTGASYVQQNFRRLGRHRGQPEGPITADLLDRSAKDARYALAAAHDRHVYLPIAALITELLPSMMAELDELRANGTMGDL